MNDLNLLPVSFKARLFSTLYEALLLSAVTCVGLALSAPVAFGLKNYPAINSAIVGIILLISWYVYFESAWKRGQTLPMKTWHIVLKTHSGHHPHKKQRLSRFIWASVFLLLIPSMVYAVSRRLGYPPKSAAGLGIIWWLLPYGWIWVGKKGQTLYDSLSNTQLFIYKEIQDSK